MPNSFSTPSLSKIGEAVYSDRLTIMNARGIGTTTLYNLVHSVSENSGDIKHHRKMHLEMDQAVAAAYGWCDLDLGHGFHETKQGVRYTISDSARRTVLDKLLELNHQRYAEEVKAGLHEKKGKKSAGGAKQSRKQKVEPSTLELF